MTQTAVLSSFLFFFAGILSFFNNCLQNTKLVHIPHFGIKKNLKLLKTCHKNGLKIDGFYTHHGVAWLTDLDGNQLTKQVNVDQLKKFYA